MTLRNIIIGIASVSILIGSISAGIKQPEQKTEWQNLKVLPQDISGDSLKAVMKEFNNGLGVKCGFCHAKSEETGKMDFASDANKHKDIARKMYTMTRRINEEDFKFLNPDNVKTINAVQCATCHKGEKEPVAFVVPTPESKPQMPPPPPPPPSKEPLQKSKK